MFADDVMVFLKPKEVELHTCARVLEMYGIASGLQVNADKSVAIPIHCSDDEMAIVTRILGSIQYKLHVMHDIISA